MAFAGSPCDMYMQLIILHCWFKGYSICALLKARGQSYEKNNY